MKFDECEDQNVEFQVISTSVNLFGMNFENPF